MGDRGYRGSGETRGTGRGGRGQYHPQEGYRGSGETRGTGRGTGRGAGGQYHPQEGYRGSGETRGTGRGGRGQYHPQEGYRGSGATRGTGRGDGGGQYHPQEGYRGSGETRGTGRGGGGRQYQPQEPIQAPPEISRESTPQREEVATECQAATTVAGRKRRGRQPTGRSEEFMGPQTSMESTPQPSAREEVATECQAATTVAGRKRRGRKPTGRSEEPMEPPQAPAPPETSRESTPQPRERQEVATECQAASTTAGRKSRGRKPTGTSEEPMGPPQAPPPPETLRESTPQPRESEEVATECQSATTVAGRKRRGRKPTGTSEEPKGPPQAPPLQKSTTSVPQPTESEEVASGCQGAGAVSGGKKKGKKPAGISEDPTGIRRTMTVSLPPRPDDGGKLGKPIPLVSNCWNMTLEPMTVWMYDIEAIQLYRFGSESDVLVELRSSPKEKRELLRLVVDSLPKGTLWDGGRLLYSETQLPGITSVGITKDFDFIDPINLDKKRLTYRMKETGTRSTADVVQFVERPNGKSVCSLQDSLRILDCVVKLACVGPFASLGRMALFDQKAAKVVSEKLMVIHRGFVCTVRPQWKLRINVDETYKAFFPSGNLADILYKKYGDDMCPAYRNIERDLRGIRLLSKPFYKTDKGKLYQRKFTVHGISSQSAEKLMIKDLNQSVQQYFEKTHGLKLQYPYLPCVKVKKTDVFIPMELLEVIPFQAPTCSKTDVSMEVIRCAAIKPEQRFRELQTFVKQMLVSGPPLLRKFGITVSEWSQKVTGRVLTPPTANFGGPEEQLRSGKWEARRYYSPARQGQAIRYFVLSLPRYMNDLRDRQHLITNLPKEAADRGIRFDCVGDESIYPPQLEEKMRQLQSKNIDLVILILSDDFNYSKIKRLSDLQMGMRTQCIRSQTFTKRGFLRNLLLKINIKLDGLNWILPAFGRRDEERIMVFGADVTHPSATQRQELQRSLAAVVGSLSKNLMQYQAIVCQQATKRPHQVAVNEVINDMRSMFRALLEEYCRRNNGFPTKLIFYRDGVSEGQFHTILSEELSAIQKACYDLCPGNQIPITFIVVQKRHYVRFKPENAPDNIPPGTVVDTEVTLKSEFDFYLCSQEGIQGTSKPAHYRVLYDDNDYRSDALQAFTYALCHAYMRCTRSVSYPAPTYYSHLAAFRAREWLNGVEDSRRLLDGDRFLVHEKQKCSLFFC